MYSYEQPASIVAVGVVLPVLGIVSVALRFYTRRKQGLKVLVDDWLIVPALLCMIGFGATLIVGVMGRGLSHPSVGPGVDAEASFVTDSPENVLRQKIQYATNIFQTLCLGLTKASIVFFYRRLFCTGKRSVFSRTTIVVLVLLFAWTLVFFFVFLFTCGIAFWANWALQGAQYCQGPPTAEVFAISDVILDTIVFILPLPIIWGLRISLGRRLFISGVFILGALAIVMSIIRLVMTIYIVDGINSSLLTQDGALVLTRYLFWSMLENGIGVIIACLPTLYFLLTGLNMGKMIRRLRGIISVPSPRSSSNQNGEDKPSHISLKTEFAVSSAPRNEMSDLDVGATVFPDLEASRAVPRGRSIVQSLSSERTGG